MQQLLRFHSIAFIFGFAIILFAASCEKEPDDLSYQHIFVDGNKAVKTEVKFTVRDTYPYMIWYFEGGDTIAYPAATYCFNQTGTYLVRLVYGNDASYKRILDTTVTIKVRADRVEGPFLLGSSTDCYNINNNPPHQVTEGPDVARTIIALNDSTLMFDTLTLNYVPGADTDRILFRSSDTQIQLYFYHDRNNNYEFELHDYREDGNADCHTLYTFPPF